MNQDGIREIADAVLYEGYILYPYRKSALKNRQRWTFGGLFPQVWAEREGGERWYMQCECLLRGHRDTRICATLRFLQVASREIGRPKLSGVGDPKLSWPANAGQPGETCSANRQIERTEQHDRELTGCDLGGPHSRAMTDLDGWEIVPELQVGAKKYLPWEEAIEREVAVPPENIESILREPRSIPFCFPAFRATELLQDDNGNVAGAVIRSGVSLSGRAVLSLMPVQGDVFKLTLRVENHADCPSQGSSRSEALPYSFASTHAVLNVEDGEFLSLVDAPADLNEAARACVNEGCWPVLAGEEGKGGAMLASPIILYDYPQIAPESDRDLFDGTEIDEILILRTLTLTEAEKEEMAAGDPRARLLLERLESLSPEELGRLHGAWRSVRHTPQLASVSHGQVAVGARVRLKPRPGGDIMDIVLKDKIAVIEAIERDFEDRVHVAVVLEDDPGREFGLERLPGHRFFFSPEEIEPMPAEVAA